MGRSGVEYHGTDAEASLTSGRRPSGVGGYTGVSASAAAAVSLLFTAAAKAAEETIIVSM